MLLFTFFQLTLIDNIPLASAVLGSRDNSNKQDYTGSLLSWVHSNSGVKGAEIKQKVKQNIFQYH